MVGHEQEADLHYLEERLLTAGLGRSRLNQCFLKGTAWRIVML